VGVGWVCQHFHCNIYWGVGEGGAVKNKAYKQATVEECRNATHGKWHNVVIQPFVPANKRYTTRVRFILGLPPVTIIYIYLKHQLLDISLNFHSERLNPLERKSRSKSIFVTLEILTIRG
jgi:hypothetical protein